MIQDKKSNKNNFSQKTLDSINQIESGNIKYLTNLDFNSLSELINKIKSVKFSQNSFIDFVYWSTQDFKIFNNIILLLEEIDKEKSYKGKPEKLKFQLKGWYSRRINKEHRLIYKIENNEIVVATCKLHYK